jgi:hypothetical protein
MKAAAAPVYMFVWPAQLLAAYVVLLQQASRRLQFQLCVYARLAICMVPKCRLHLLSYTVLLYMVACGAGLCFFF